MWRLWFSLALSACIENEKDTGPSVQKDTAPTGSQSPETGRDSTLIDSSLPIDSGEVVDLPETDCYARLSLQFEPAFEGECLFDGEPSGQTCSSISDCPSEDGWSCEGQWVNYPPYTIDGCVFQDDRSGYTDLNSNSPASLWLQLAQEDPFGRDCGIELQLNDTCGDGFYKIEPGASTLTANLGSFVSTIF